MGGVTKQIGNFIDDNVPGWVDPFAGNLWSVVSWQVALDERIAEEVLKLLGIEDEDLISAEVTTQRIITDDVYDTILNRIALDHQAEPEGGVIEHFMRHTTTLRAKYQAYQTYGEDNYMDGLPETSLNSSQVDPSLMASAAETDLSIVNVVMLTTDRGTPGKEEYVGYYLRWVLNKDFQAWDNTFVDASLPYPTSRYKVQTIDFVFTNNTYDVAYELSDEVVITVTEVVSTAVIVLNPTEDTVTTTTSEVTTIVSSVHGTNQSSVVTSTVEEVVPTGTVSPGSIETLLSTDSEVSVLDSGSFSVPAPSLRTYYIGKFYYDGVPDHFHYYLYDTNSETHPELLATNYQVSKLEMLPIVSLRNNGVSVTANKGSSRYAQTSEILNTIGIDLDSFMGSIEDNDGIADIMDVFVIFAVSPQDSSKAISKVLYEMFAFIYDDAELYIGEESSGGGYTATVQEDAYNSALSWKSQSKRVVTGSIGLEGTYSHSASGGALYVRKQANANQYIEYKFSEMGSVTIIDRKGADDKGVVSSDIYKDNFVIPLSMFYVDQLSSLEQSELFAKSLHLSIYSAQVTHLEYYETAAFGSLLKAVSLVIMVWSWGTATKLSTVLWTMAAQLGAALALKMVFKATDNEAIRLLATVMATYATGNAGGPGLGSGVVLANNLTNMVTTYYNHTTAIEMAMLKSESDKFGTALGKRKESLNEAEKTLEAGLSTVEILQLSLKNPSKGYLEGVDAQMYIAKGSVQYNYGLLYNTGRLKGEDLYDNAFRLDLNRQLT